MESYFCTPRPHFPKKLEKARRICYHGILTMKVYVDNKEVEAFAGAKAADATPLAYSIPNTVGKLFFANDAILVIIPMENARPRAGDKFVQFLQMLSCKRVTIIKSLQYWECCRL